MRSGSFAAKSMVMFGCVIATSTPTMAFPSSFGEPYYTTDGAFALEPELRAPKITRRIASFLPHHTLLFKDPEVLSITLEGKSYKTFITQHGQRLLVRTDHVSDKSVRAVYGDQTIIYHEDGYICDSDTPDCDADSDTATGIKRGDVLQRVSRDGDDLVKLRVVTQQEKPQDGVLRKSIYERQEASGVFTDSSRPYPRFLIKETTRFGSLGTSCGEIRKSVNTKTLQAELKASAQPGALLEVLTQLSSVFSLKLSLDASAKIERQGKVEAEYGDPKAAFEYSKVTLSVFDPRVRYDPNSDTRTFFIATKLACVGEGPDASPVYMEHVTIKEGDDVRATMDFATFYGRPADPSTSSGEIPQFRVYRFNGSRPFLTSVNSRQAYTKAFRVWQDSVEDPSLAAIFLSMFNASCPDKSVGGRNQRQECNKILQSAKD